MLHLEVPLVSPGHRDDAGAVQAWDLKKGQDHTEIPTLTHLLTIERAWAVKKRQDNTGKLALTHLFNRERAWDVKRRQDHRGKLALAHLFNRKSWACEEEPVGRKKCMLSTAPKNTKKERDGPKGLA